MLKKSLMVSLFILVLSCPAFANDWDGITFQLQTKNIAFELEGDVVHFYTDSGETLDHVETVSDEEDYYKIILESGRYIMLGKEMDRGKLAMDNMAYLFHRQR